VTGVGAALVLIGLDVIPQRVFRPNVPSWLLVVLGLVLVLAGASVFLRIGSPTATRLIGVSLTLMALVFSWVALFGDPRYMSGGIPFIPDEFNWLLGRIMFGLVALLFLWLGVSALRHAKHQPEEGVVGGG
jgi:multisubunit Na+/H+ antiporter MnhB subunit